MESAEFDEHPSGLLSSGHYEPLSSWSLVVSSGTDESLVIEPLTPLRHSAPFHDFRHKSPYVPRRKTRKHIHIITHRDEMEALSKLLAYRSQITMTVFMENVPQWLEDTSDRVLKNLTNQVWIFITHRSVSHTKWTSTIERLMDERKQRLAAFRATGMLEASLLSSEAEDDFCSQLPQSLQRCAVQYLPTDDPGKAVRILESCQETRLERVCMIFDNPGPFFRFSITMHAHGDLEYLHRAQVMLVEILEDPRSYVRQEMQQKYRMPNNRIVASETTEETFVVEIESRPLELCKLEEFVEACEKGFISVIIRSNVKVGGSPFVGQLLVALNGEQVSMVKKVLAQSEDPDSVPQGLQFCENNLHAARFAQPRMMLKILIATNFFKSYLEDKTKTPYDFLKLLKDLGCENLLFDIMSVDGYNALHLAIVHRRADFFMMFIFKNLWGFLRQEPVYIWDTALETGTVTHKDFTPRRLAEGLVHKSGGYELLLQFSKLDDLWLNLPNIAKAFFSGNLDLVKLLIESEYATPEEIDSSVYYACGSGHVEIVSYLISKKVRLDVQNHRKETCVHAAALAGHVEVLRKLQTAVVDLRGQPNVDGHTALDLCVINGDTAALHLFREHGLLKSAQALLLAVAYMRNDAVVELLQHIGGSIDSGRDELQRTALHHSVINTDPNLLCMLLNTNASISNCDKYGKNVFHLAAEFADAQPTEGAMMIMAILIEKAKEKGILLKLINLHDYFSGKDEVFTIRGRDRGRRAWHNVNVSILKHHQLTLALNAGQLDLSEHGSIQYSGFGSSPGKDVQDQMNRLFDINLRKRRPDMTPLHIAVNKGKVKVVELLLLSGADPNSRSSCSACPVHIAAMRGHVSILALLEKAGANLSTKTNDGKTAVDVAAENHQNECVNYMKAKMIIQLSRSFLRESLDPTHSALQPDGLSDVRDRGRDLRTHIVNTLRNLTIDVNILLVGIGSGPVTEPSVQLETVTVTEATGDM